MEDLIAWLEKKSAWHKIGDQQVWNVKGERVSRYLTYANNQLQVAMDTTNGEVSLLVEGKTVLPFSKSMVKHLACFQEYIKEFQQYETKQGPLKPVNI